MKEKRTFECEVCKVKFNSCKLLLIIFQKNHTIKFSKNHEQSIKFLKITFQKFMKAAKKKLYKDEEVHCKLLIELVHERKKNICAKFDSIQASFENNISKNHKGKSKCNKYIANYLMSWSMKGKKDIPLKYM